MVKVSAPGKILLIGAYSVLEPGNVAYTLAIDQRVRVSTEDNEKNTIDFYLEDFNINVSMKFDGEKLKPIRNLSEEERKYTNFIKNATEITLRYMNEINNFTKEGMKIYSKNDEGFTYQLGKSKSGFGSSSAAVTSTVAGIFEFYEMPINEYRDDIHKIAQISHIKSQNKIGSGFDVATAVFGPCIYRRFSPEIVENLYEKIEEKGITSLIRKSWNYTIQPVEFPKKLEIICAFTGKAADTRKLVKKINEYKKSYPEEYKDIMLDINYYNECAVNELRYLSRKFSEDHLEKFVEYFNKGWELTKELGKKAKAKISTKEFDRYCEAAVKVGALCSKLPGAGGGDSVIAITMNEEKTKENVFSTWKTLGIKPLPYIKISKEGVRRDD